MAAPGGGPPPAPPPGEQDRRAAAKLMLQVSKQLWSVKQRALLRLEQGGRLDRAAARSYDAYRAARGAAGPGSYLRTVSGGNAVALREAMARELEQLALSALLEPTVTLPMLAVSLQNKLLTGRNAERVQFLMGELHLQEVQPVVLQLAFGPARCLEVLDADVNGATHLYVVRVDGEAAARHTGTPMPQQPPAPKGVAPWQQGAAGVSLAKAAALGVRGWLPRIPPWPEGLSRPIAWEAGPEEKRRRAEAGAAADAARQAESNTQELVLELLDTQTAREQQKRRAFEAGAAVRVPCPHLTKEACQAARNEPGPCNQRHFRVVIKPWTKPELGNCAWLHSCHTFRCPKLHYEEDHGDGAGLDTAPSGNIPQYMQALKQPQWITGDVRYFDLSILGKFQVVMADPPWEIHQFLNYGLMSDAEMKLMDWACLQDNGVMFLWVTGARMELARDMLAQWGYTRVDELVWIKTNQLCQLNRGGITGHYLNHSKEHCLVAVKGTLSEQFNRYMDCDVVMSMARETSRKPDEMYLMLERLCPGGRKLEIFAREHNLRPGWISIGNQLQQASFLHEPELRERFHQRYGYWPNGGDPNAVPQPGAPPQQPPGDPAPR